MKLQSLTLGIIIYKKKTFKDNIKKKRMIAKSCFITVRVRLIHTHTQTHTLFYSTISVQKYLVQMENSVLYCIFYGVGYTYM